MYVLTVRFSRYRHVTYSLVHLADGTTNVIEIENNSPDD